jgi:hypothetical protein
MAWQEQSLPLVAGWGGPPDLRAAPGVASIANAIAEERMLRQFHTEKTIADAIKEAQAQQESRAYTEALQKAGLLPEGDYGGLGIQGGHSLADMIQKQKAQQALEAHRAGLLGIAQQRVSRSGGGGGGGGTSEPETRWDAQGREWRQGPGGRWIPMSRTPGEKTAKESQPTRTERGWAAPEIPGVSVNINAPDEPAETLQPNIPPAPDHPAATGPTPPPADQNVATGYGTDATSMSADDVRAAYRAGKMDIEEAKARLKQLGFAD